LNSDTLGRTLASMALHVLTGAPAPDLPAARGASLAAATE